jgi:hypothetical protein
MIVLSKSSYLLGIRCPKALYLAKEGVVPRTPETALDKAKQEEGRSVGQLAQKLFPGGLDMRAKAGLDLEEAARATTAAIERGATVLYEAAFIHQGVYAALDILVRDAQGWKVYEVKASTEVKDEHIPDVTLQVHVVQGAGLQVADVSIVTLNGAYEQMGPVNVNALFQVNSVHDQVVTGLADVPQRIAELNQLTNGDQEPAMAIGPQCTDPRDCPFKAYCWKEVPKGSVLELTRGGKKAWGFYHGGLPRMVDLPDDVKLSEAQQRQVAAAKHGTVAIDRLALRAFVAGLKYPLHHFDFETFAPAVPLYDRTRPYQQVPFQYSIHIQDAPGSVPEHREFLADGVGDPREALVKQLLEDIGQQGDILAYHASFERDRLKELARDLPMYAAPLEELITRLKDLETPFTQGWYYVPAMNGRSSIKAVLPALVPALSYKDLTVQEGGTASLLYTQLATGQYTGDVEQLRKDLLAYCGMDTFAMVKVLGVLVKVVPGA